MTTTELEKELRENVNRGIEHLNDFIPNWREKINCSNLNLAVPCNCIIGQLNLDVCGFDPNLGFSLPTHLNEDLPEEVLFVDAWNMLTDIWKEKINDG